MDPHSHNFKENASQALKNKNLQSALSQMKVGFIERRQTAVDDMPEFEDLRDQARDLKNHTLANLDFYLERYEKKATEAGGHVHGRSPAFGLAERILSETDLPVVVSGGITTGEGLAAALAIGASGVQCGTAFLATEESFAHPYHKSRIVAATGEDTVLTDVFVLNWPKGAAVRVIGNSVTDGLQASFMGHDPATLPRETIAHDEDKPRLRFSTDSPLRTTTGDLEAMALFAGQGAGTIQDIPPAAKRLADMTAQARRILQGAARNERKATL